MKFNRPAVAGVLLLAFLSLGSLTAGADSRQDRRNGSGNGYVLDHRFNHDHYYPERGSAVRELPGGYYSAHYRGSPYFFHGGVWYRSYGPRYVVVRPPVGIFVPLLPPFYTTVWVRGAPYYYADDTFYVWRSEEHGYEVTEPPEEATAEVASPSDSDDVFVYPKNGQGEEQQASDRYECHSWAVGETGFDPTQPLGGVSEAEVGSKRADYRRAEAACLEARGYSVK